MNIKKTVTIKKFAKTLEKFRYLKENFLEILWMFVKHFKGN